ncbi:hypothetical protein FACS1894181_09710 [Bacteroidia bacterium]|nr:hypothetical protein FACS1894181_09710 [Bacteroidia bacterium]
MLAGLPANGIKQLLDTYQQATYDYRSKQGGYIKLGKEAPYIIGKTSRAEASFDKVSLRKQEELELLPVMQMVGIILPKEKEDGYSKGDRQ